MYIVDGIAYAGEPKQPLKVCGVRPLDDFLLWVRFNNGEAKIYDFKPLINLPVFKPLADVNVFRNVYIDYNTAVWNNGDIDIAPEELYNKGISAEQTA
ncbi:MAG: DUF2442 domain-containing protein [Clostridia bacterium]|nr:DUF2442 domain-containing protein [Clostridia bacterium]